MQRHDLDLTSLVAGLLFSGLAAGFLADGVDVFDLPLEWVWPVLLIGLGLAFLMPSRAGRDRD